jgi:hypothetical protein
MDRGNAMEVTDRVGVLGRGTDHRIAPGRFQGLFEGRDQALGEGLELLESSLIPKVVTGAPSDDHGLEPRGV